MDKGHFLTPNSLPSTDFRPMIRGRDCLDPRAEAQSIAIEEQLGLDEDKMSPASLSSSVSERLHYYSTSYEVRPFHKRLV